ncbi:hypothetical protein D3C85_1309920 [compost metagenome]
MRHRTWRREVRPAVLLLHRHAGGDLVQFVELEGPEEFVEVEIAVIALSRPGVGTEEMQLGAVRQNDRIAGEINLHHFAGEGLDVGLENVRLRLAG